MEASGSPRHDVLDAWAYSELIVKCTASLSIVGSVYLFWCCLRLPRRKLLARQVMNLAASDFCAFTLQAVSPWAKPGCNLRNSVFFFLLHTSVLSEAHIAIGTLLVVARWHRSLQVWGHMLPTTTWLLAFLVQLPQYLKSQSYYDDEFDICVQVSASKVTGLVICISVFVVNIVAYTLVCLLSRRNSPRSVTYAYLRCSAGYLGSFLVTYTAWCVYLIHNYRDMTSENARVFFTIGMTSVCTGGVTNAVVYRLQQRGQRGECCPCGKRGEAEEPINDGDSVEPRTGTHLSARTTSVFASYAVAYEQDVEVFDVSVFDSVWASSAHDSTTASMVDDSLTETPNPPWSDTGTAGRSLVSAL